MHQESFGSGFLLKATVLGLFAVGVADYVKTAHFNRIAREVRERHAERETKERNEELPQDMQQDSQRLQLRQ